MKFAVNYIGLQVKAERAGKAFLGDVVNARPFNDTFHLDVNHFNGEPWPWSPELSEVEILGPTWLPTD